MNADSVQSQTASPVRPSSASRGILMAFLGLAAVAWLATAVGANARTPGIVGAVTTLIGGFCLAVLIAAIGGWVAITLSLPGAVGARPTPRDGLDPRLAAPLDEAEAARREAVRQQAERTAWRAPVCAAAALACWSALVLLGAPGGVIDFAAALIGGALAGFGWSVVEVHRAFDQRWRERVLPALALSHGELGARQAPQADLSHARSAGLLPPRGEMTVAFELAGVRAGRSVRILQASIAPPREDSAAARFDGLVVDIGLDGNGADTLERLAAARPGLGPALLRFQSLPGLAPPRVATSRDHLTLVLARTARPSLFETPGYHSDTETRARLERISAVIDPALALAEALGGMKLRP